MLSHDCSINATETQLVTRFSDGAFLLISIFFIKLFLQKEFERQGRIPPMKIVLLSDESVKYEWGQSRAVLMEVHRSV